MMKKKQSIAVLVIAVLVTVLLGWTTIMGWGPTGTGAMKNINLGLDLSGGVSITYQAVEENPSAEDMSDTRYKLEQRAYQYSTEAQVYQQGDNRITIDIPGVTNANDILQELGQPGSLYFIAQTDADGNQNYTYDATVGNYVLSGKTIEDLEADGSVVLTGRDVESAEATHIQDQTTQATESAVELHLTDEGTEKFAEATEAAVSAGESIGIYYDGEFVSVPTVQSAITDGVASITGMSNWEEASNLAATIRIGGLSLELEELNSQVVGAQLGSEAISTSLMAGVIGLILIILFLIVVYRIPGAAAGWALVLYVELTLVCLNAFDITLTLPGIAGIILSIGMAVDANVIIYARMREEMTAGKSISSSIREGFQKAFSAIFDGNITTLIAAAILYIFGSGSVRGFAVTLALGIVLSMFTALVISRLLVNSLYGVGIRGIKWYGRHKERKLIHFVEHRKVYFTISAVLLLAVPVGMIFFHVTQGSALNYSMEFRGGTSVTVPFNEDYSIEELDAQVQPVIEEVTGDSNIQMTKIVDSNNVMIRTRSLSLEEREEVYASLEENFGVDSSQITFENISATISDEMSRNAATAVVISILCMLVYIWFRFKDIRFASSAILALIHDIIVVFGVYVFARISVGNTFIACMLTILGYSINATIVIFDRIRENMALMKREPLELLVDKSVTQTLTRSIYSTLTTFVMVFILFLLGVSSIRDFAAPLMVGIAIGGYTSVCLTGSMWFLFKHIGKNKYVPVQTAAEVKTAEVSAADNTEAGAQKKKKKKKRKQ